VKSITLHAKPAGFYYNLKLYNRNYFVAAHCEYDDVRQPSFQRTLWNFWRVW